MAAVQTFCSRSVRTNISSIKFEVGISLFGDTPLTKRSKERGYLFFSQGYVHETVIYKNNDSDVVEIKAKCYRSMRKSQPPHKINLIISPTQQDDGRKNRITESTCSCVAG